MQQKIEALIQEEQDPRERARLLVLHQIVTILIDSVSAARATSDALKEHRDEYELHIEAEKALLNQGRGMWRVLGAVLVGAQSLLGYSYYEHIGAERELQAIVAGLSKDMEVMRERHRIEDRLGRQP